MIQCIQVPLLAGKMPLHGQLSFTSTIVRNAIVSV